MRSGTLKSVVISIAAAVALMLFVFGLSYPLNYRVLGDARKYLEIANGFTDLSTVLNFAGNRTVGFPFFESLVRVCVSVFSSDVQTWINAVCGVLLVTHFVTAWYFSRWVRSTKLIQTESMSLALFFFLATYPALIGHTTSPLTDTFAVDLILCALMALQVALTASSAYMAWLSAGLSAFFFGFSILVRPSFLLAVAVALVAGIALTIVTARRKTALICATALGCVLVLAPYYYNCSQKYGSICLQSPETFDIVKSAQAGLRGARTLWSKGNGSGQIPTLPDATLFSNYYQRCQLTSIVGIDDTTLTGCLITRPVMLPVYAVKKWIGLFDHFRFTPYLENDTPLWLIWLGRAYDSLAWIGFSMVFMTMFLSAKRADRPEIREKLTSHITPMIFAIFSAVMLALHTALHIEDRYGFPVIPLSAVVLAVYGEKLVQCYRYRTSGCKRIAPLALYCIVAWTAFVAQIMIWDNSAFY